MLKGFSIKSRISCFIAYFHILYLFCLKCVISLKKPFVLLFGFNSVHPQFNQQKKNNLNENNDSGIEGDRNSKNKNKQEGEAHEIFILYFTWGGEVFLLW